MYNYVQVLQVLSSRYHAYVALQNLKALINIDGSNRPDSEEILESAKDSFSAAYLLKKSKKYQARESKVEVLSSNLQSMLADLKSTLSDIDNL